MTQSNRMEPKLRMPRRCLALVAVLAMALPLAGQDDESFSVAGEHPLLFLHGQRARRLERERDRRATRWLQFQALMTGRAAMPEPGFALALYHYVAKDEESGRRAVEWALGPAADLRQLALVYDWCQAVLSEQESARLAAKIARALDEPARALSVSEARSRALAAIVLSSRSPALSERELQYIVRKWWRGEIVPAVNSGREVLPRSEFYALFELLHAIRDNLHIDLRESLRTFFTQMPHYDLISYYPAIYPAAENDFRIPAVKGAEPDLAAAAMSRIAEMAMVAYDSNAPEMQYLQGWLMHDRFILRGPLGAPYEFLWANPYQPGLSYFNLPLAFHDKILGRVFVRSRWNDDAAWLGYFDGQLQTFSDGEPKIFPLRSLSEPVQFGDTVVAAAPQFTVKEEAVTVYVVGLEPSRAYGVEPDDQEMHEAISDPGGIIELQFPTGFRGGIRLKPLGRELP
ncbi:MAG TPA: hypothetical protein PKW45_06610 [Bryobacteraceae bacterium]|nr:hypothetical protein [Bryobacteraceae bacterium]